jgi:hypothetical protein
LRKELLQGTQAVSTTNKKEEWPLIFADYHINFSLVDRFDLYMAAANFARYYKCRSVGGLWTLRNFEIILVNSYFLYMERQNKKDIGCPKEGIRSYFEKAATVLK